MEKRQQLGKKKLDLMSKRVMLTKLNPHEEK